MSAKNEPSNQAPRYDLYGPVHKGLRREFCSLLARMSSVSFGDDAQVQEIVRDVRFVMDLCAHHLKHENNHFHVALEERSKGASAKKAQEHVEHEKEIAELRELAGQLEKAAGPARHEIGRKLYLVYSRFVGENLVHMAEEELQIQPQFHEKYSDPELMAIEGKLLGSIAPDVMMAFMRGMIPAMNRDERAGMLGGMKQGAPPEAFNAVLQVAAKPSLSEADWKDLTQRLGI
ncbi:hypothetical protein [Hyalangium rubrum]|uniref:Hemerythrin-like domain-containing protein n=1 Tax=Hyalangium rubrum TaxID=3103134 RepID=A0ABU5H4W4_9BACT|nr:hypothetical protein [Hyalangium sp. s54d21]MDY7227125.1 hypothetical protein [Hyalangium sp. s54d21]